MIATSLSQREAEKYLDHIEVLAGELTNAMEAMVAMELPAFELSVHRQRLICANLASLPQRAAMSIDPSPVAAEPVDAELRVRLQDASRTLNMLNKRYSALLEHSGDTLKLIAGLLRTYSPPTQSTGPQQRLQTWSCTI